MLFQLSFSRPRRCLSGLAVTLGLHLALLYGWQQARLAHKSDNLEPARIEWLDIAPPKPVVLAPTKPRPRALPAAPVATATVVAPLPPSATEAEAITLPAAPATPMRSAAEMMQQARRDVGKIDKDLQKEFPGAKIKAPADSPQLRLERGIEHAAEMAPPKWFEAAKVSELIDPGTYGRKRYRVITASGTYCVTYESNHAPDGLDTIKNGITPKITRCDENEQPATTQKW